MKVNKAPEKINRTTTYLDNDKGKTLWKEVPVKGAENLEYTRTDIFIKKAANWLENTLKGVVLGGIYVEDFKKYMKGE